MITTISVLMESAFHIIDTLYLSDHDLTPIIVTIISDTRLWPLTNSVALSSHPLPPHIIQEYYFTLRRPWNSFQDFFSAEIKFEKLK